MLSSGLARLAVIEPGRQRVNFEVLASRTCIDGGTRFSADAITVTAMTEAGEDVVERVSTSLERGDRHLVELDVPRTAQRVTLVLAVEPTIGVLRQTVAVAALIEPTFRPRDPGAARLLPFEGSRLVCVGFDQV